MYRVNWLVQLPADDPDDVDMEISLTPTDSCEKDFGKDEKEAMFDSFRKMLFSMVPSGQNLARRFTNPCWYVSMEYSIATRRRLLRLKSLSDREARHIVSEVFGRKSATNMLYCIPKVFLAGFPKSGSTSIYDLIVHHPLVVGAERKEPHWWTRFPYVNKFPTNVIAFLKYMAQYRVASRYIKGHPNALAIDGSQSTIWDTRRSPNLCDIPKLISSLVPNGKYIVIMREPAARLYSDFRYQCTKSWLKNHKTVPQAFFESAPAIFYKAALDKVEKFERCLKNSTINLCTHYALSSSGLSTAFGPGCGQARIGISLYQVHIARWLRIIPREQFLFLRTEDFANDPYAVMKEIWSFLGLEMLSEESLNDALYTHSNVNPLSNTSAAEMRPETQAMLQTFFQPFNQKLVELLGDDRFLWADTT